MGRIEIINKLNSQDLHYPILAWIENDHQSQIILITIDKEFKLISSIVDMDLNELYTRLENLLGINDLRSKALEGDNTIHIDKLIDNEQLSWDYLLNETHKLLQEYNESNDKGIDIDIYKELFNNYINDLSVSILENIYKSIIYILLSEGSTIGITDLMIVGDIVYDKGLSKVLQRELPEEYNITLIDLKG